VVWQVSSVLDDHLECPGFGSVPEGLVGIEDVAKFEAMGDQNLGVDLVRPQNVEEHRRADGIDQPRGDGDVTVPQALQMESHLRSAGIFAGILGSELFFSDADFVDPSRAATNDGWVPGPATAEGRTPKRRVDQRQLNYFL